MIGTNEEYKVIPPPTYESTGGQGDLTTGCGSCREKISNATFDMTAGFKLKTSSSPAFLPRDPRDRLNAERSARQNQSRVPEENIKISTKKGDCNCDCKDKQLKITTGTPNYSIVDISKGDYVPEDAIGEWYGRKMPEYHPVNPIDQLYGRKMPDYQITLEKGSLIKNDKVLREQQPCENNEFPNNNLFIKQYFISTPIDRDCNLFFYVDDPINAVSYPININVSSCCAKFTKNLWCKVSDEDPITAINTYYEEFYNCLSAIFDSVFTEFIMLHPDLADFALAQLTNQFEEIKNSIIKDKDRFIDDEQSTQEMYFGNHSKYCICSGDSTGLPTFCCDPYYEDGVTKRPECWCPDGSLKNLCEDCEENIKVNIPLPTQLKIFDIYKTNPCGNTNITEDPNNDISYVVQTEDGEIIDFGGSKINELNYYFGKYGIDYSRRELNIKVPKNKNCTITFKVTFICNWCCDVRINVKQTETNRRRVLTIVKKFNYSDYESSDKLTFLNFDKEINAPYLSEEFNKDDATFICENCP